MARHCQPGFGLPLEAVLPRGGPPGSLGRTECLSGHQFLHVWKEGQAGLLGLPFGASKVTLLACVAHGCRRKDGV